MNRIQQLYAIWDMFRLEPNWRELDWDKYKLDKLKEMCYTAFA